MARTALTITSQKIVQVDRSAIQPRRAFALASATSSYHLVEKLRKTIHVPSIADIIGSDLSSRAPPLRDISSLAYGTVN